ncbi:MAG: uroporphyrinogen decarboxylase family protein [Candidatus Hodarchaeota archaeon]
MDSLELVKAALKFNKPERVPVFKDVTGDICPLLLTVSKKWKPGWGDNEQNLFPHGQLPFIWEKPDWAKNNPEYENDKWKKIPHEEIDEWGCIWNMKGNDKDKGHPGRPVLLDWEDYDKFIHKYNPNPNDKTRYEFAQELKRSFGEEKYRMVIMGDAGPFQRATNIRGFTKFLIDHKKHPNKVKRLLMRVTQYYVEVMKSSFKYGLEPHGFYLDDDLGEQTGPFFSPKTFENFYGLVYKTLFKEAHNLGTEFHLHSCGKIDSLLSSLIEWGLDAIELDSPRMSGYPSLKVFVGKIMFWACINIQSIYPKGTPEECEREVWHMIRNLGTKKGGFGAYFYPTPHEIHVPKQNIRAFKKGLKKYGTYSDIPQHWWNYPVLEEWDDNTVPSLPPLKF